MLKTKGSSERSTEGMMTGQKNDAREILFNGSSEAAALAPARLFCSNGMT